MAFNLIFTGCASESETQNSDTTQTRKVTVAAECDPGDTGFCTCSTGEAGVRVCSDIARWLACQCPLSVSYPDNIDDYAPAVCALAEGADLNPEVDVGQVTRTIAIDYGDVPDGGHFEGDPSEIGPFHDIHMETIEVPIVAEQRQISDLTINVPEGTIKGKVYLPEENEQILDGSLPLVVVLAGWQIGFIFYEEYAAHAASYGFAVMGLDTRSNQFAVSHGQEAGEISQSINWIIASEDSPLKGKIDTSKIALLGHSKGGKLTLFASALDHRIDIAVAWDPSNTGGPPCLIDEMLSPMIPALDCNAQPVAPNCATEDPGLEHYIQAESLIIGVPRDELFNPDAHHNSIHFYRGAPSPSMLVLLDGNHTSHVPPLKTWLLPQDEIDFFLSLFGDFLDGLGGVFGVGHTELIEISRGIHMALLLKRFKGMTGEDLDKWLPDNPAGVDHLFSHEVVLRAEAK